MRQSLRRALVLLCLAATSGCLSNANERAAHESEVGRASVAGVSFAVEGGLAAVREIQDGTLELWAQAPMLRVLVQADATPTTTWLVRVRNCLPDAVLTAVGAAGEALAVALVETSVPSVRAWLVALPAGGATLDIAPVDASLAEPFRFGVLSDIQSGVDRLPDILARINEDARVRFVISAGDLASQGSAGELAHIQDQLLGLDVPFYATLGNHDAMGNGVADWHALFGRTTLHFVFKGVTFTLADSGNGGMGALVYAWLDGWLSEARDGVHVFVTHFPLLDPDGLRNASFASRNEAARLIAMLAEGRIDVSFYGHIHTFAPVIYGGTPGYISGGGGAIPQLWDGIGRHYLAVDASAERIESVAVVRIDE